MERYCAIRCHAAVTCAVEVWVHVYQGVRSSLQDGIDYGFVYIEHLKIYFFIGIVYGYRGLIKYGRC